MILGQVANLRLPNTALHTEPHDKKDGRPLFALSFEVEAGGRFGSRHASFSPVMAERASATCKRRETPPSTGPQERGAPDGT
jgi:hypothetical protein